MTIEIAPGSVTQNLINPFSISRELDEQVRAKVSAFLASQKKVLSRTTDAEPTSPADGDAYIITATPTGTVWAGLPQNTLAIRDGLAGKWNCIYPIEAMNCFIDSDGFFYTFNGTSWVTEVSAGGPPTGAAGGDLTGTYPNPGVGSATFTQTGLKIKGATAVTLAIKPNETLTVARTLSIVTGNANRSLTFTGDASIAGTNTGDQTSVIGNAGTATQLETARQIDGVNFDGSANIVTPGRLLGVPDVFITGTGVAYTPQAGATKLWVEVVGGGGGGGGCTSAAVSGAAAGGGGSGGYTAAWFNASGGPFSYTVGADGAGGANDGSTGTSGGDSSFDDLSSSSITSGGGVGGVGATAGTTVAYVSGGAGGASTGILITAGGAPGVRGSRATGLIGASGAGGSSHFGGGAVGLTAAAAGTAARSYGSGGSGGLVLNNSGAVAGGAGSVGIVIVWNYS